MLSILIPTFGVPGFLTDCLQSVAEQDWAGDVEVLLGIDGCEDTLGFVEHGGLPGNVRAFWFEENAGPYVLRNTLAGFAQGERLLFFDSDDVMLPSMLSLFMQCRDRVVLFTGRSFGDGHQSAVQLSEGVVGVDRDLLVEQNGFMPWRCAADTEFLGRVRHSGVNVGVVKPVCFLRRLHGKNLTMAESTGFESPLRAEYRQMIEQRRKTGWVKPEVVGVAEAVEL